VNLREGVDFMRTARAGPIMGTGAGARKPPLRSRRIACVAVSVVS